MSKKTLLNENTVRKFMKFANLGGLSDTFINENYLEEDPDEGILKMTGDVASGLGKAAMAPVKAVADIVVQEDDEETLEEIAPLAAAGLGAMAGSMMGEEEHEIAPMDDDMPADDLDVADDAPVDDAPVGDELPPEAVSALEKAVEAAADAMLDALAPFGVEGEASVEGDDLPPVDMDAEAPPMDLADEPELPGDEGPDDEEVLDEIDMIDEDAIVNETLNRVMKRLSLMSESQKAEAEKDKMISSVADAIVARLRAKK